MNRSILILPAVLVVLGLAACDKPPATVINVPPPVSVPGPAGPPGDQGKQGNQGNPGEMGKPGESTTVIVAPAASAASN